MKPWFEQGLRFACTRCGNCCRGAPGTVRVTHQEIVKLAQRLKMSPRSFRLAYTRPLPEGDHSLREKENFECVFWDREKGCTVYEDRPLQCRTWPFWRQVVRTPGAWADQARSCPGMNQGELHGAEQIVRISSDDGTRR